MTMTMSRDLPVDLVEDEILCRLPAMYLKRLKSICKRWHHLFNGGDSRFARKHTDTAAKQFRVLMLKVFRICPTIIDPLNGSVEFKNDLSLVDPQSMYSAQFDIEQVFHCDGLLLCNSKDESRFVVWNPVTGFTRWFLQRPTKRLNERDFALGYYQENNEKKRYKVLSFSVVFKYYELYEFSSDSWKTQTQDDIMPPGWSIRLTAISASLKGNTYWFGADGTKAQHNLSLLKFDFQTEKFVPVPLPYKCSHFESYGLSVVREEKLSVLLQPYDYTSKTEIWVTNKIDDTTAQVVSWSKVLALDLSPDLQICDDVNFLLDEEKKFVTMHMRWLDMEDEYFDKGKDMIYTVGEDGKVNQMELKIDGPPGEICILNYVPSLVQIEKAGRKRKRGDL